MLIYLIHFVFSLPFSFTNFVFFPPQMTMETQMREKIMDIESARNFSFVLLKTACTNTNYIFLKTENKSPAYKDLFITCLPFMSHFLMVEYFIIFN